MSTTVTVPPTGNPRGGGSAGVAAYVAAVRAELADLGPDEVEELTGGLEADLADTLAADGGARGADAWFGEPAAYAAELRAAAGLAPRAVAGGERRGVRGGLRALAEGAGDTRDRWTASLRRQPWWPGLSGFLVSLRPAWWLLRAFVAVCLAESLIRGRGVTPHGPVWLLVLAACVLSVQLGRRGWARSGAFPRFVIAVGNLLAVVLLLPVWSTLSAGLPENVVYVQTPGGSNPGLYNGDYQVTNIFPYGKDGKPLKDVRLYDDRGQPLDLAEQQYAGKDGAQVELVPGVDANGQQSWNNFPLGERVQAVDPTSGTFLPPQPRQDAKLPDPTQPPLVSLPTPGPTSAAGATPGATPAATPTR